MRALISVHGRFHAFELAHGLFQRGCLQSLFTTYPAFIVNRLTASKLPVISTPQLEIYRRLMAQVSPGFKTDLFISKTFGRFAAKQVELSGRGGVLIGWSSATLEAIKPAHKLGKTVIIE